MASRSATEVGVRAGIDDDTGGVHVLLDEVNDGALGVGLEDAHVEVVQPRVVQDHPVDILERLVPVYFRLPFPEEVEVRPVDHEYGKGCRHVVSPLLE